MIIPRTRAERKRYLRHKVIAILVTFAVVYGVIRFVMPREMAVEKLESLVLRSPAEAFQERATGELVHAIAVLEAAMPDTLAGEMSRSRWRARTRDGHPFVVVNGSVPFAAGDTVVVRGGYIWDTRGGAVDTRGTGPESEGGERPGFLRRHESE